MANKGRVYERLFERDFGYRAPAAFIYLPRRYKINPGLFTPFPGIVLKNQLFPSTPGVADYTDGTVHYFVDLPGTTTPAMAIRIEWNLTLDESFALSRLYLIKAGTDILWIQKLAPFTTLPFLNWPSQVTYIPPFTGPVTGWSVGASEMRWAD